MRLAPINPPPRPGHRVQCAYCLHMKPAETSKAILDAVSPFTFICEDCIRDATLEGSRAEK